jgi:hypothetical protein
MAWAGSASDKAVQFLGSYALRTMESISYFLSGVAGGVYDGFNKATISAGQTAQAIYNNPQFLEHISTNILNTITDPSEAIAGAQKLPAKLKNAPSSFTGGRVGATINSNIEIGFVFYIRNGCVDAIEGYTYGEEWPDSITNFDLYLIDFSTGQKENANLYLYKN